MRAVTDTTPLPTATRPSRVRWRYVVIAVLCAGAIVHATGMTRLSQMGGLARHRKIVTTAFVVGVPLFSTLLFTYGYGTAFGWGIPFVAVGAVLAAVLVRRRDFVASGPAAEPA